MSKFEGFITRLVQLTRQYGAVFTIEEAFVENGDMDRLRSYRYKPAETTDLDSALDDMVRSVPDFTWQKDPQNPRIVHIVDDGVERMKSYALDQVIDNIDFSGQTFGLVQALAAKGVPISPFGAASGEELHSIDYISSGHIQAKGLAVREVLTQFLPLVDRGEILWIARTSIDGKDRTTYVRFVGIRRPQPAAKP